MRVYQYPNGDLGIGDPSGERLVRLTPDHSAYNYFLDGVVQGKMDGGSLRPTGQQMFDAMTHDEQDAQFGPDKAQLLRDGKITLADLVQQVPQDEGPDFITAKPLQDLPEVG